LCDHLGKGSLAAAGRAVKEQTAKGVGTDEARQQTLRPEQVLLPDHLRKVARAHPHRKRPVLTVSCGLPAKGTAPGGASRTGNSFTRDGIRLCGVAKRPVPAAKAGSRGRAARYGCFTPRIG